MVIQAAYAVEARKKELNDLNVFPVPDGDTGINMSATINAAARELEKGGTVRSARWRRPPPCVCCAARAATLA